MRSFVALSVVLLATSVSASPALTVKLKKLSNTGPRLNNAVEADRNRGAFRKSCTRGRPITVLASNLQYELYTTTVGVGSPPTYYELIVDTGSSNTFVGTGSPYVRTPTSIPTGQSVNVSYGLGNFTGLEYLDQVTIGPNLVVTNQSIGDALSSYDFEGVDGILGVGPVDLTQGTLSPDTNATIPTVMNNLMSQGLIENQVLGVYFAPGTSDNDTNGALTYGGADPSLYQGELTYVPLTETYPAAYYWGINITSSMYGNDTVSHTVIPTSTAGIVDTGTTPILIADDLFDVYLKAIPGATLDNATGLIILTPDSIPQMGSLNFTIANRVFTLDVAAQIIPMDENQALGLEPGIQYGVVGSLGTFGRVGLDFIIGQKFMERYYAVFDADANRIGFAQTNNTYTTYQG